jgi:hypothetical protein
MELAATRDVTHDQVTCAFEQQKAPFCAPRLAQRRGGLEIGGPPACLKPALVPRLGQPFLLAKSKPLRTLPDTAAHHAIAPRGDEIASFARRELIGRGHASVALTDMQMRSASTATTMSG